MLRRTLAFLTSFAAVLCAQPAVAAPVPPPPPLYQWIITCATGAFTSAVAQGRSIHLEGWIQPCSSSAPWNAKWSLADYRTTVAYAYLDRYPPEPGRFTADGEIIGARGDSGTFALCLLTAPTHRLACVGIGRTPDGGSITVTTMPVNDPRLDAVPLVVLDEDPEPTCATCI